FDIGGTGGGATLAVLNLYIHRVGADAQAGGTPARIRPRALHGTTCRGVAVGQWIVIWIASVHVNGHGVIRSGKDGRWIRGASRNWRMISRRRRCLGQTEAQDDTATDAEIILASVAADSRSGEIRHQVVYLSEAPS